MASGTNIQFPVLMWWTFWTQAITMAVGGTRSPGESRVLSSDEEERGPKCYSTQDTYCEDVIEYPSVEIRRFLNRNNSFKGFFNRARPPLGPDISKNTRIGNKDNYPDPDFDEERVCDVTERLIRPRAAKNRNGDFRYIVNDGHDYQQHIKIETCRRMNGECSGIAGVLASGYTSRCAQKFAYNLLVAFDERFREPVMDDFQFPTACVCLIRHRFYR